MYTHMWLIRRDLQNYWSIDKTINLNYGSIIIIAKKNAAKK